MFTPMKTVKEIEKDYKDYIKTARFIAEPDINELFKGKLDEENLTNGPYLDVTDSFLKGKTIHQLIDEGIASEEFKKLNTLDEEVIKLDRSLYLHQEKSFKKIAVEKKSTVITTGTGSGKTESFLYPVLNDLMKEKEAGNLCPGVRTLIIYPMNALAADQMKRIREILKHYPDITFGIYNGETEYTETKAYDNYKRLYGESPIVNEIISREKMKDTPPNILITNYAMLEFLLLRPKDKVFFESEYSEYWKHIILDEAHSYYGSLGIEISMLLSRLKEAIGNRSLQYVLTSATLGGEDAKKEIVQFANNLVGSDKFTQDAIIFAERESISLPSNTNKINSDIYSEFYREINGKKNLKDVDIEIIKDICRKYNVQTTEIELKSILFEIVTQDSFYYDLKKTLEINSSIQYILEKMNISENELIYFVDIASKSERNGVKPFDAKYHTLLRTIEGCYVSFGENPKLSLKPIKKDEAEEKYYEISVCQYCGKIYLKGLISDNTFIQDKEYPSAPYYMITRSIDKYDLESHEIYKFYANEGKVIPVNQITNNKIKTEFYLVKNISNNKEQVYKCLNCNGSNNKGLVHDFYFGQGASTSVVATSLYKLIPSKTIEIKHENKSKFFGNAKTLKTEKREAKQFLAFSDSRQQAAHFASYFNETYNQILKKKLILKSLEILQAKSPMTASFSYNEILSVLSHLIKENMEFYSEEDVEKVAEKALLYEITTRDRNSLKNLGLINLEVDFQLEINEYKLNDNFNLEENNKIMNILLEPFIYKYAIKPNGYFNSIDFEEIFRVKRPQFIKMTDLNLKSNSKLFEKLKSVIAHDTFEEMFDKSNDCLSIYPDFIENVLKEMNIINIQSDEFTLNATKFNFSLLKNKTIYKCTNCKKVQKYKMGEICLNCLEKNCLVHVKAEEIEENHHYIKLYNDNYSEPLIVKEHTAQLDPKTAKQYQQKFINKKINVLSCSTTFEMGVDVGDLETVFLRNIPPSPANYIQRAGRAGRSADAAAFILTFCKNASHDLNYFNKPIDMIKGKINPPLFNRANKKIMERHFNAIVLSKYWKYHPDSFKDTNVFFEENNINELCIFIKTYKSDILQSITDVCPPEAVEYVQEYYETINSANSPFLIQYENFKYEIDELESIYNEKVREKEERSIYNISRAINTLKDENIISFLSRKNILPKYGFPVDTVELQMNEAFGEKNKLRLSRDLSQAISEYAPGSNIIADGYMYTSRYINLQLNKTLKLKEYALFKCNNEECKHINIKPLESKEKITNCRLCNTPLEHTHFNTMVIPRLGFTTENDKKLARTTPPRTSQRSEVYYVGSSNVKVLTKQFIYGSNMRSSRDDELMVVSKNDFYMCDKCGYTLKDEPNKKEHRNKHGYKCDGKAKKPIQLGHIFKTDVLVLEVEGAFNFIERMGLLYALLDSVSDELNIERSDIDGTTELKYINKNQATTNLIFFDNVPGGAGHVKRIFDAEDDELIKNIFLNALNKLRNCTCSEDASCYNCLRSYNNQLFHDKLIRKDIIGVLERITGDIEIK